MRKFAVTLLAAVALAQSGLSAAADKPSSFVPHPHTKNHVYGAPISRPLVGHARTSHHSHTPKKRSSSASNRAQ
jgi:hypothetical protein